jgi:hypothetical protein
MAKEGCSPSIVSAIARTNVSGAVRFAIDLLTARDDPDRGLRFRDAHEAYMGYVVGQVELHPEAEMAADYLLVKGRALLLLKRDATTFERVRRRLLDQPGA